MTWVVTYRFQMKELSGLKSRLARTKYVHCKRISLLHMCHENLFRAFWHLNGMGQIFGLRPGKENNMYACGKHEQMY